MVLAELRLDETPGCDLEDDCKMNTLPSAVMYVSDGLDAGWLDAWERKVRDGP